LSSSICVSSIILLMASAAIIGAAIGSVAVDAPTHVERLGLSDYDHFFDFTVAFLTGKSGRQVARMIEMHEIGQPVDSRPFDRFAVLIKFGDFLDIIFVYRHRAVAPHADIHSRDVGKARAFGIVVTIQAGDMIIAGVKFVAERDRLFGGVTGIAGLIVD
jgi:hypothetical protein